MSTLSFTGERRVRFPAPDVARGFMLALIALANVPFWVRFFPDYPAPGQVQNHGVKGAPKAMMSVSRDAEGVLPDSLDGIQNDANS